MGIKQVFEKATRITDLESEIEQLNAKLQESELEKQKLLQQAQRDKEKLQAQIDVLKKSAQSITDSDSSKKQNYELRKIIENFTKELKALDLDTNDITLVYNVMFVAMRHLVIPILNEFGETKEVQIMQYMYERNMAGIALKDIIFSAVEAGKSDQIEPLQKKLKNEFINDDARRQRFNKKYKNQAFAHYFLDKIVNHATDLYYDTIRQQSALGTSVHDNEKEFVAKWLEVVLSIGSWLYQYVEHSEFPAPNSMHIKSEIPNIFGGKSREYADGNIMKSTSAQDAIHGLLLHLSKTYGIDMTKIEVMYDGADLSCQEKLNAAQITRQKVDNSR